MWLLSNEESGVKFLFWNIESAVTEIKNNRTEGPWTLEEIAIYDDKLTFKIPDPNVVLNTETGKVDKKVVRTAPVPLNRTGDVE